MFENQNYPPWNDKNCREYASFGGRTPEPLSVRQATMPHVLRPHLNSSLTAAGNGLPGAVVDPGSSPKKAPVPDVTAQASADLIERGDAVRCAEPLPQHQRREIERAEDQGQKG